MSISLYIHHHQLSIPPNILSLKKKEKKEGTMVGSQSGPEGTKKGYTEFPTIDLNAPDAKDLLVEAFQDLGFCKVINHGVPGDLIAKLEAETARFFELGQPEKDRAATGGPLGYGNKMIGPSGELGCLHYLILSSDPNFVSRMSAAMFPDNPEEYGKTVNEYISRVRGMLCNVLELVADGLKIEPRDIFSRPVKDEKSDSILRLNNYPACPDHLKQQAVSDEKLIAFGEHTDHQILTALISNVVSGLQIFLKDGTWVTVPSDNRSFFLNVGNCLQVMTNGRLKSVRHRVVTEGFSPRLSMVFFGGPPLDQIIKPLPSLMKEGEESLYKEELTWSQYRTSAAKFVKSL